MGKTPLTKLDGIGNKTAEEYSEQGFEDVESIATENVEVVMEKLGLNKAKAEKLIARAQRLVTEETVVVETLSQVQEYYEKVVQKISTGSIALDLSLGGGVETSGSILFAGNYGTGKTQIDEQLAVNCIVDLHRKAFLIETEPNTIRDKRLKQMSQARNHELIGDGKDCEVFIVRAPYAKTPEKMFKAYEVLEEQFLEKGVNIGYLGIDSFIAPFALKYHGRTSLQDRNEEMSRHISKLQDLASKYNIAICMTGQVRGIPDERAQGVAVRRTGIADAIIGGECFLHSATVQVSLSHVQGGLKTIDEWRAYVFDSSSVPKGFCEFVLCPQGVRDSESFLKELNKTKDDDRQGTNNEQKSDE